MPKNLEGLDIKGFQVLPLRRVRRVSTALRRLVERVRTPRERRERRIARMLELTEDELERDIYIAIELGFTA